jgi:hypothetical protein
MTKRKAIKASCFDCAGESQKEVTFCTAFNCPLWPFRTGESPATYRRRMETALRNYAPEVAEMTRDGIEISKFSEFSIKKPATGAKKSFRKAKGTGNPANHSISSPQED